MRIERLAIIVIIVVSAVACEKPVTPPQSGAEGHAGQSILADFSLAESNVQDYLKYKQIDATDKSRRDRAVRSLIVRNALAQIIVQQEWSNQSKARTHIKDRRNQILINSYFDDYISKNVSDQAIQSYFEKNKKQFAEKKVKSIQMIVTSPEDKAKRKETIKQLREFVENLKQGGDFNATIKKHPVFKKAKLEQAKQWQTRKELGGLVFGTAMRMKKGDVAGPMETRKGLLVVKLVEDPLIQERPLSDVRELVLNQLKYRLKLDETARLNKLAASRIEAEQLKFHIGSDTKK